MEHGNQENPEQPVRVRMPRGKELIGFIESRLAGNKLKVRCQDDKYRICRIPGKIKKRVWIKEDDYIILEPWDIQGDRFANVIWKYTPAQVSALRKKGVLNF